jgi:hypothetical protein
MTDRRSVLLMAAALLAPTTLHAAGDKKEAATTSDPFTPLPTITASVIRADGRRGVLTVQATLHAAAPAQQVKIRQSMPRLMDAYVRSLQGWAYRMTPGAVPNVDTLAQVLQGETDRLMGRGVRLLLGGVMVA